jgi:hypothetical protein
VHSGTPVTATVEIADRNPLGSKGVNPATGIVELPESNGATDQAGSGRASQAGGGAVDPAVGSGNEVTGISPIVAEGQSAGTPTPHQLNHLLGTSFLQLCSKYCDFLS